MTGRLADMSAGSTHKSRPRHQASQNCLPCWVQQSLWHCVTDCSDGIHSTMHTSRSVTRLHQTRNIDLHRPTGPQLIPYNSVDTGRSGHVTNDDYLSELIMNRLWKLSACECVAVVNVLSREPPPTFADNHVLHRNRYFLASGQSCTMILLTYLSINKTRYFLASGQSSTIILLTYLPINKRTGTSWPWANHALWSYGHTCQSTNTNEPNAAASHHMFHFLLLSLDTFNNVTALQSVCLCRRKNRKSQKIQDCSSCLLSTSMTLTIVTVCSTLNGHILQVVRLSVHQLWFILWPSDAKMNLYNKLEHFMFFT